MNLSERAKELSSNIVELEPTPVSIAKAVYSAFNRVNFTVNRQNLPGRTPAEKLDHAIMGEIATNSFAEYVKRSFSIPAVSYEELRVDGYKLNDAGWDVLFLPTLGEQGEIPHDSRLNAITVSVKSSRIPAGCRDSIAEAIEQYDFKVLKYHDTVNEDLDSDIWVQVYYSLQTSRAVSIDLDKVNKILQEDHLAATGSREISSALRLRERYGKPTVVAVTTRSLISEDYLSSSKKPVVMRVGNTEKPIWPAKFVDVGRPMKELASLTQQVLEEQNSKSAG